MKTATTTLTTFLATAQPMIVVDCYTFSVLKHRISATTGDLETYTTDYRWNTWDKDLALYPYTWLSTGPIIERDMVKSVVGVEVDTLTLKIYANESMTIEGVPFLQACARDVLDGARVKLERAFLDKDQNFIGTLTMFVGAVAGVKSSRSMVELAVASDLQLLNIQMPRNLYQPGCQHTVYDNGCTKSRPAMMATGTVSSPTVNNVIGSSLTQADGYFDMGTLLFTSGALAGVMRTVKTYAGKQFNFVNPLTTAPAAGDTFKVWPGCDKSLGTCGSKFSNTVNFRGFPFVPAPETAQ